MGDDRRVPSATIDLRAGFRRLGGFNGSRPPAVAPRRRLRLIRPHTWTPEGPRLGVFGAVDGIQSLRVGIYRSHRPILLAYVAAGCLLAKGPTLAHVTERLFAVASHLDENPVRHAFPELPVEVLEELHPDAIAHRAAEIVEELRRHVEAVTISSVEPPENMFVLVDGDLRGVRPGVERVVGVIKDTSTPYADVDPEELRHGECSPVLELLPERRGERSRFTCYSRIGPSGPGQPEGLSLVRLETFDPDLLGPLAISCRGNALHPTQPNSRAGSHLRLMAWTEEALRGSAGAVLPRL